MPLIRGGGGGRDAKEYQGTRHVSEEATLEVDPLAQPLQLMTRGSKINHPDKPFQNP